MRSGKVVGNVQCYERGSSWSAGPGVPSETVSLFDGLDEETKSPDRLQRVRLVVSYDGSPFHGFAANAGVKTVGGTLGEAIEKMMGHRVELTCAGRTDKGVHALGQVVTFDVDPAAFDPERMLKSLNALCGPAISVSQVDTVDSDFDARFSALSRRYRYRVTNRDQPDPFTSPLAWHVPHELSLPVMTLACDALIGEYDFSAFCRRPKTKDGQTVSLVRRLKEATWFDDGDGNLRFEIESSSFCHQMVRSVVGTLVAVGRGQIRAGDIRSIMASGDRAQAGDLAPPHGLMLWTVRYPGWEPEFPNIF